MNAVRHINVNFAAPPPRKAERTTPPVVFLGITFIMPSDKPRSFTGTCNNYTDTQIDAVKAVCGREVGEENVRRITEIVYFEKGKNPVWQKGEPVV